MLEVNTNQYKRCDLVKATGRIDSQTSSQLADAFDAINAAGRFKVVFDMSDVEYISSAGLRVMINVQKTCKRWNRGEMVLAAVPQKVDAALDLAGFLPLFKIYNNVHEAVGSF